MSRIKKTSDGEQLSLRKVRHRTPSSKILPGQFLGKNPNSPYKESKLSKSPSYVMMQHQRHLHRSGSYVRNRNKDLSKIDETSLSAARSNPWDKLFFHAKVIKEKLNSIDRGGYEDSHEFFIDLFGEVIEKDLIFGNILIRIRESYTEVIQGLMKDAKMLVKEIEKVSAENENCAKMLERLAGENRDLGKEVERLQEKCFGLQKVVKGIQNVNLDDIPLDSGRWKGLVYENEEYCNLIYELKADLKEHQFKEQNLLNLIADLKNSGIDIDAILEKQFKTEESLTLNFTNEFPVKDQKMPSLELSKILNKD